MMLPILLCSLVALTVFVIKLFEFKKAELGQKDWVDPAIDAAKSMNLEALDQSCGCTKHPAARVLRSMVDAFRYKPEQAAAEAKRVGSLELQKIEKNLPVLAFLAEIAPLLGLLGTVIGMVDMFIGLQGAGQSNIDISDLASGIWKALLTTAAGLAVAVPTMAAHRFLSGQSDALRNQLSDIVGRVFYALPNKGSSNG